MRYFLSILLVFLEVALPGTLALSASDLRRDSAIEEERIVSALRTYVAQRLSSDASEIRITLAGPATWDGGVSEGDRIEIREATPGGLLGRVMFWVTVKQNKKRPTSQWIAANVEMVLRVIAPTRPLKRHHVIQSGDLTIQKIYFTRRGGEYVETPEELIGKRMIRSVGPGTPMALEMVEEAPLILSGDRVTLLVEAGGMKIMTVGRAKGDGYLGRPLAVVNIDSRKVVYGEVVDASTVKVTFTK